ncbi:aldo/keto reductase [Corynebacterium phoceense]|nr:aldo/keto reductase [Corynebacterium phoceense]MCQ9345293.1 aldo/keto reductase [Corynebacterium phoceense]
MSPAYRCPSSLTAAFDAGYRFFDTAEIYGPFEDPHLNERVVGEALAGVRDEVQILTKFGIRFAPSDGTGTHPIVPDTRPAGIRASVEGSLRRLRTDHIDVYLQHRQDPAVPAEDVAGVMNELITEGKILGWGLSEVDESTLRRAQTATPVAAIENRLSMMARWHEPLLPVAEELGAQFIAFSPLANGLLTDTVGANASFGDGDYRAVMPQFRDYGANAELLALVRRLAAVHDATPAQLSLAWVMAKGAVPIPGSRKPERLRENLAATDIVLTADEVADIDAALDVTAVSEVFGGTKS